MTIVAVALVAYAIGRIRPLKIIGTWNEGRAMQWVRGSRDHLTCLDKGLWVVRHPIKMAKRNKPKPPRPSIDIINPDFFSKN